MLVKNMQNRPHAFTLLDGSTFRILANETRLLEESLVSPEMLNAQKLDWITFISDSQQMEYSKRKVSVKRNK